MIHPHIPTNRTIRTRIKQILFGTNIFCPCCRTYRVISRQDRWYCPRCRKRFSLLSHTFLKDSKVPLQTMWLIVWCFVHSIPVKQTQSLTDLSEKGVRHWYGLLRHQLVWIDTKLKGRVQIDEVYLGGFKGKAIIAGKDIVRKEVRFHICKSHQPYAEDMYEFFKRYIVKGSTIRTDSSPLYPRICRMFSCTHERDIHAKFEFHLTSEIEGMFGNIRTFMRRMYHHVTVQNLEEYLMEFQHRFSRKKYFTSVDQFLTKTLKLVPTG